MNGKEASKPGPDKKLSDSVLYVVLPRGFILPLTKKVPPEERKAITEEARLAVEHFVKFKRRYRRRPSE